MKTAEARATRKRLSKINNSIGLRKSVCASSVCANFRCWNCKSPVYELTWSHGTWRTRSAWASCCRRSSWSSTMSRARRTDPNSSRDCSCKCRNHSVESHRRWSSTMGSATECLERWRELWDYRTDWSTDNLTLFSSNRRQIWVNWIHNQLDGRLLAEFVALKKVNFWYQNQCSLKGRKGFRNQAKRVLRRLHRRHKM